MSTIEELITKLSLTPHVEGGYFKETYRSEALFPHASGRKKNLVTLIYFLLPSGRYSKFHRIASDEIWVYQLGAPVLIHVLHEDGQLQTHTLGGDIHLGHELQVIIPAKAIFGAEVSLPGAYSLSACMVAPGFDFIDFEVFDRAYMINKFPQHKALIEHLHQ